MPYRRIKPGCRGTMSVEMSHPIDFQPLGRRGRCAPDQTLLDCARDLGLELVSLCGGNGTCGRCRVQILEGSVQDHTGNEQKALGAEELNLGFRLACQVRPMSGLKVRIPAESLTAPQRMQVEGADIRIAPDPPVLRYEVTLTPPTLDDPRDDIKGLRDALHRSCGKKALAIDLPVLQGLSPLLRGSGWRVKACLRGRQVVAVGAEDCRALGMAVDLGTTKIAGYILDLENGETLSAAGSMNPQIAYGEDVISRISHAGSAPREARRLQEEVVCALNEMAERLCARIGASPSGILEAVVVGNTAMHHLFLGLPVEQLAISPYVPAVRSSLDIKARDLGLAFSPGAYVHLLPNIAGFVGADHVATLLATEPWRKGRSVLVLDIGTNTEVCLSCRGEMTSVSCASGPAFEGAHITHGMRAAHGAIEHLELEGEGIRYQTIGGGAPVGLCGSGILDAVAQMRRAGIVDSGGRMGEHPRIRSREGVREFVLIGEEENEGKRSITVTQKDVRELQLAKGAMRAGIRVLLDARGLDEGEIDRVIIAGAFGTYIDVASAVTIGMVPPLPLDRFDQIGNAAGTGARLALLSMRKRRKARDIADRVGYIELARAPGYAEVFARSIRLE